MENKNLMSRCVKYIIFAGITYSILKMLPSKKFSNMETFMIISIVVIGTFSLDCLTSKNKENFVDKFPKIDVGLDLDIKENIDDTSGNDDMNEDVDDIDNVEDVDDVDDVEYKETNLESKVSAIKEQSQEINVLKKVDSKIESKETKINCDVEVIKMRKDLENTIIQLRKEIKDSKNGPQEDSISIKYMNSLLSHLKSNSIIDKIDEENIMAKIESGTISIEEMLTKLEKLKELGKSKPRDRSNDMKYSELPSSAYEPLGGDIANQWDEKDEYTILSTSKWSIPQKRPPVCVESRNKPCDVCPSTAGYPASLKEFDNSRYVSNLGVNKKWVADQNDTSIN